MQFYTFYKNTLYFYCTINCVGWKMQVEQKGIELCVTVLRSSEWTSSSVFLKAISYETFFLWGYKIVLFCELRNGRLAHFYDGADWWRGNLEMESLNKRRVKNLFPMLMGARWEMQHVGMVYVFPDFSALIICSDRNCCVQSVL